MEHQHGEASASTLDLAACLCSYEIIARRSSDWEERVAH
jgi:hypothetical protein